MWITKWILWWKASELITKQAMKLFNLIFFLSTQGVGSAPVSILFSLGFESETFLSLIFKSFLQKPKNSD